MCLTKQQQSHLSVQDLGCSGQNPLRYQGSARHHRLHGDGTAERGGPLQLMVVDDLDDRPLQAAVGTEEQEIIIQFRVRLIVSCLMIYYFRPRQDVVVHQGQRQPPVAMETGQVHLVSEHQGLRGDAGLPQQQEDVGSEVELRPRNVENRKNQRTAGKTGRRLRDRETKRRRQMTSTCLSTVRRHRKTSSSVCEKCVKSCRTHPGQEVGHRQRRRHRVQVT